MRKFAMAACLAVGLAAASSARASDQISSATLDQFGLGGMQSMTDEQGMQIRAKGVSIVQVNVLVVYDPAPNVVSQQISQGGNNTSVILTNSKNNYVQQNAVNGVNYSTILTKKHGR